MTPTQWTELVRLLEAVTNVDLPTWQDKRTLLLRKMGEFDGEGSLAEIVNWFGGDLGSGDVEE